MDTTRYKSVAVKKQIVDKIGKLAEIDIRSIPHEIQFLAEKELRRREEK